jgi:3-oxoacyl-[acyl-carrier-protein] synthase III
VIRSRIVGTGRAVPPKKLTNDDLSKMVDTSDSWIFERTGIRERHILDPSLAASDLATEAGEKACRAAGIAPADVDCIIVGTVTGDCPFPATATFVQKKLGARSGGCAFDLSAACAGFLYGMSIADGFIRAKQFKNVLVIGVEVLSRIVDWTDRATCVLFGDGAGAVLMTEDAGGVRGLLSTHLYADGTQTDILLQKAGGSREPLTAENAKRFFVHMNGREVYKHAVRNMAASARTALEANGLTPADVAWVIGHLANLRILEGVSERVGIPMERFFLNVDRYGNTSSASVPTALDEAIEQKKLREGDILLFTALGGGLAWASAAVRW